jgi:RecA-family ATPase
VFGVNELLALDVPEPEMLIEGLVSRRGASLLSGASKAGKTIFGTQLAISISSGSALFEYYRILHPGPVLLVEQDDPDATASVKAILRRTPLPVAEGSFYLVEKVKFCFGLEFLAWLESEISRLSLRLVVLDSYTALRGPRVKGSDIVKAERDDLSQLNDLAKRMNSAIVILHHNSKGSAALEWSQQAAGTFAMGAATESQIFISRFQDLGAGSRERLVRVRGRHFEDKEMVLRFRKNTMDYEHVMEGEAAPLYPLILQIRSEFGTRQFAPKELIQATGVSRATAHRQIERLYQAGALIKRAYGVYSLEKSHDEHTGDT